MLLTFQRRFEAPILAKTKRHTIRAKRKGKRQWRPGDICDCYVDSRQKTMRCFGRWPCVRVQDITIKASRKRHAYVDFAYYCSVWIDGHLLSRDECELLAAADGFKSFSEMMGFWKSRLTKKPFHGDTIHWDPDSTLPARTRARRRRTGQPRSKRPTHP